MSHVNKNSISHFTYFWYIFFTFVPKEMNFTFYIFVRFFKQNTLINVRFAREMSTKPLENGRFVWTKWSYRYVAASIRYRFRRKREGTVKYWQMFKHASKCTYRGTNASVKYRSKSFLQLTSFRFTCQFSLSYNSFSIDVSRKRLFSLIPRKCVRAHGIFQCNKKNCSNY